MRLGDVQKGIPFIDFSDTKANIEAISNPIAGMRAYATDLGIIGIYNGVTSQWDWRMGHADMFYELANISKDANMIAHFDGALPYATDFTGNPNGHMGQVGSLSGGAIFTYGKFGKALQTGTAGINICTNPVFNTAWEAVNAPALSELSTNHVIYGVYSQHIIADSAEKGALLNIGSLGNGKTYTISGYLTVVSGNMGIRVQQSVSPYTIYGTINTTSSGWISATFTMPADVNCNIYLSGVGEAYYDVLQLEESGFRTPFMYGDMPGCSWSGTAHASTSARAANYLTYVASTAIKANEGSYSVWVKLPFASGSANQQGNPVLFRWMDNWNTNSFYFRFNGSYAYLETYSYQNSTQNPGVASSSLGWDAETWHHVVLTWKVGEPLKIYIDGQLSGTSAGNWIAPNISSDELLVSSYSGDSINGMLDDLAIIGRALTTDEVKAIYESDAPLMTDVIDVSESQHDLTLINNWVNYGSNWQTARYMKDKQGFVHIQGLIRNGTSGRVGVLPIVYRPAARLIFPGITSPYAMCRIDILNNGNIELTGYSTDWVSLTGVSFYVGSEVDLGFIQPTYAGQPVYGVSWDKTNTALTRTNASVGMVAAAGVDTTPVTNDFDTASIYSEFTEVTDADGNVFIRIPKFYIRKTDRAGFKSWQISKAELPGSYVPWCFMNFTTGTYNDYIYVGKYPAGTTLTGGTKLNSLPNEYPLVRKNIVDFRGYAEANGAGYQQLDIHVYDMLQVLFTIEFATLDSQGIMAGWTSGQYNAAHALTADTVAANTIVVSNATGAAFAVGQPISLGTAVGSTSVFYGRNITQIDVDTPGAGSTTITVDGEVFSAETGNVIWNCGWKSGFSSGISATSGSLANNTNYKNPFHYRGIENLYGNVWQFVDGLNINARQAWYCKDADDYASKVFASPYEKLGYVNKDTNGYVKYMGFDPANPMVELPVDVSANFYKDYYYQSTAQYIAFVGGGWNYGGGAGLWAWYLNNSSASANVNIGGRLVKKG